MTRKLKYNPVRTNVCPATGLCCRVERKQEVGVSLSWLSGYQVRAMGRPVLCDSTYFTGGKCPLTSAKVLPLGLKREG